MRGTPYVLLPIHNRAGAVIAYAKVDPEDVATLARHRWSLDGYGGYARRNVGGYHVKMHRQILGLARGDERQGDHISGDRLDNRRANLRIVTAVGNAQNRRSGAHSSRFRGVTFHRATGKWAAQAKLQGKHHHLGLFVDEEAAAKAAEAFRAVHMPYAVEALEV